MATIQRRKNYQAKDKGTIKILLISFGWRFKAVDICRLWVLTKAWKMICVVLKSFHRKLPYFIVPDCGSELIHDNAKSKVPVSHNWLEQAKKPFKYFFPDAQCRLHNFLWIESDPQIQIQTQPHNEQLQEPFQEFFARTLVIHLHAIHFILWKTSPNGMGLVGLRNYLLGI